MTRESQRDRCIKKETKRQHFMEQIIAILVDEILINCDYEYLAHFGQKQKI